MKCICILDGDQRDALEKYTITLPGGNSPEKEIMEYALQLYDNDSPFWTAPVILELNYAKVRFRDNIKPDIDQIADKLQTLREDGETILIQRYIVSGIVFCIQQRNFVTIS